MDLCPLCVCVLGARAPGGRGRRAGGARTGGHEDMCRRPLLDGPGGFDASQATPQGTCAVDEPPGQCLDAPWLAPQPVVGSGAPPCGHLVVAVGGGFETGQGSMSDVQWRCLLIGLVAIALRRAFCSADRCEISTAVSAGRLQPDASCSKWGKGTSDRGKVSLCPPPKIALLPCVPFNSELELSGASLGSSWGVFCFVDRPWEFFSNSESAAVVVCARGIRERRRCHSSLLSSLSQ